MINALLSDVLADAADHPGCRASADGCRVLLTGADGRVVRMYECRGPIDAGLIASRAEQHLRPLEPLADEVATRMAANPGATLVAIDREPLAGHVHLHARDGGWTRGWWAVGTHHRALQLVALAAARLPALDQTAPTPRDGLSTRARRRQRQQGGS